MAYRYYICDVFTDTRFGGNQLAVLPDARGLSDRQMQQITREFNFSESTFVLPPEQGHTRRVRIFSQQYLAPYTYSRRGRAAFFQLGAFRDFRPIQPPDAGWRIQRQIDGERAAAAQLAGNRDAPPEPICDPTRDGKA